MDQSVILKFGIPSYTDDEIEALLKEEIEWAITKGPGWNPNRGACFPHPALGWNAEASVTGCGTCAIGALLVHRQPTKIVTGLNEVLTGIRNDVASAAAVLGRSQEWVASLYYAVASSQLGGVSIPDAEAMGHRLRDYGNRIGSMVQFYGGR